MSIYGETTKLHNQFLAGALVGFTNRQLLFLKDNLTRVHEINLFENGNSKGSEIVNNQELHLYKLTNKTEFFSYDDPSTCHCGCDNLICYKAWYRNNELFMIEFYELCDSCVDIYSIDILEDVLLWHIGDE